MVLMSDTTYGRPILEPGRNCWRLEPARRVAFLVDGAAYFAAVRAAAAKAQHSIFILGWDIDSRMRLVPEGADDGLPEPLGDFLNALAKRSRKLCIHILNWNFAMLYAPDRPELPGARAARRLHAHFGETPAPATFPSGWPLFALDRLWVNPLHCLRELAVHRSPLSRVASDHLPLAATLELENDHAL
jgi:hypothetical protein